MTLGRQKLSIELRVVHQAAIGFLRKQLNCKDFLAIAVPSVVAHLRRRAGWSAAGVEQSTRAAVYASWTRWWPR
jgi:hypothetical protein